MNFRHLKTVRHITYSDKESRKQCIFNKNELFYLFLSKSMIPRFEPKKKPQKFTEAIRNPLSFMQAYEIMTQENSWSGFRYPLIVFKYLYNVSKQKRKTIRAFSGLDPKKFHNLIDLYHPRYYQHTDYNWKYSIDSAHQKVSSFLNNKIKSKTEIISDNLKSMVKQKKKMNITITVDSPLIFGQTLDEEKKNEKLIFNGKLCCISVKYKASNTKKAFKIPSLKSAYMTPRNEHKKLIFNTSHTGTTNDSGVRKELQYNQPQSARSMILNTDRSFNKFNNDNKKTRKFPFAKQLIMHRNIEGNNKHKKIKLDIGKRLCLTRYQDQSHENSLSSFGLNKSDFYYY